MAQRGCSFGHVRLFYVVPDGNFEVHPTFLEDLEVVDLIRDLDSY